MIPWDLDLFKTFKTPVGSFLLGVQYADYEADNFSVDSERLWVTVQHTINSAPQSRLDAAPPAQVTPWIKRARRR